LGIHGHGLKGKVYLYSAIIAAYEASAELSSQTGPAYILGRSPSPLSRTLACSHTAVRNLLMISASVIHVIARIITHLARDGRLSCPNWLTHGDHLPTKNGYGDSVGFPQAFRE